MIFRRERPEDSVTVGAVFRRLSAGEVMETAKVLSIARDPAGIPHVRYAVHYDRVDTAQELRTLALTSFNALFRERVSL